MADDCLRTALGEDDLDLGWAGEWREAPGWWVKPVSQFSTP